MRSTLRIILYLFIIVLGLLLVAIDQRPELADQVATLAQTMEGRWAIRETAAVLMSSPLVILLNWFQSIRRNREISYENDNGRISVDVIAIEEALIRAIKGESGGKRPMSGCLTTRSAGRSLLWWG